MGLHLDVHEELGCLLSLNPAQCAQRVVARSQEHAFFKPFGNSHPHQDEAAIAWLGCAERRAGCLQCTQEAECTGLFTIQSDCRNPV